MFNLGLDFGQSSENEAPRKWFHEAGALMCSCQMRGRQSNLWQCMCRACFEFGGEAAIGQQVFLPGNDGICCHSIRIGRHWTAPKAQNQCENMWINIASKHFETSRLERCVCPLGRIARSDGVVPNLFGSLCGDARIHVHRLGDDVKVFKCARYVCVIVHTIYYKASKMGQGSNVEWSNKTHDSIELGEPIHPCTTMS
jgi:hypothetical protein